MTKIYDAGDTPKTGFEKSRIGKDESKGIYHEMPIYIPGDNVTMEYEGLVTKAELEAGGNWDANLMPFPSKMKALKINTTTSGYSGDITVYSGETEVATLTFVNGLLTTAA